MRVGTKRGPWTAALEPSSAISTEGGMVCYTFSVTPKPLNGKVPIESFSWTLSSFNV